MSKTNPSFLNGVPELLVLQLLARREMYGYEIVRAIQEETKDAFAFGEGCIYPYLHHLQAEGWVSSRRQAVEGRSRNYYTLLPAGRQRLEDLTREWRRVAAGIGLVLEGGHA